MKIPLNNFEENIDERILSRAYALFKDGLIIDFTKISTGIYEAIVSSTQDYIVHLEIKKKTVVSHHCDCPYDMGPVCKHVVAVIFYFCQDDLELGQTAAKVPKKKKTKSLPQQVTDLLKEIPHTDLIEFISDNSKRDKKFRDLFLAKFNYLNQDQSKELYKRQIHSILKSAAGRDGFIWRSDMRHVVRSLDPFVKNAEKYLADEKFEYVFFISSALLEEITEAFQYGDDSDGGLGYFIDKAMNLLLNLADEISSSPLKQKIFEYCIASFSLNLFEGWDWHLGILEVAGYLAETEAEVDAILNCLDAIDGEFEKGQSLTIKLDLIRRFKDEKEVEKFVNEHISNYSIRKMEIAYSFNHKDIERVIQLSKDGIKFDEKDRSGYVKKWYNWLLKAAQFQEDSSKVIEYARFLFIDNHSPEQDYYKVLRTQIDDKDWHAFLEEVIEELVNRKRWTDTLLMRKIYISEKWWDKLFLWLKENCSLRNIQDNEEYLAIDYSVELIEFYSISISEYLENNVGRKHYKTTCKYLRRMKELGGTEMANELIESYRKLYPRRIALMEELDRV